MLSFGKQNELLRPKPALKQGDKVTEQEASLCISLSPEVMMGIVRDEGVPGQEAGKSK